MELVRGQIVTSRKGRDVTKPYVVLAVEEPRRSTPQRATLCNGEKWPLEKPKLKSISHIQPTGTILPEETLKTDTGITTALKPFWRGVQNPTEGKGG